MKKKIDHVWVGMVAGTLGSLIGFLLFGMLFAMYNHMGFTDFFSDVFIGVGDFQSRIVSISMLVDVVLFFVLIRRGYYQFCKGLMAILVLSVAVVAWLY